MKNVMELLRAKEQELLRVKRQVEALRVALPLLRSEDDPTELSSPSSSSHTLGIKSTGSPG
jgi:hypothetical protein